MLRKLVTFFDALFSKRELRTGDLILKGLESLMVNLLRFYEFKNK